ncbi:branched-chain amino acid ABC transporter permease [Desertibaculum subflavum]|uniref:branched-chain amino acid ABC transporter permease n=1 Tax=Desertibaculum subflavum TaxID=2268458 RepID=UPI0013C5118F
MEPHLVGVLTNIGMIAFVALSAYLLLLVGEISFGQQAFFGIGAYAAGIGTAVLDLPLGLALAIGAIAAAIGQLALALPTFRLRGLYFAMASLAFAEMMRIVLELTQFQVERDGELVGPNGAEGFRGIRYIFERGIEPAEFLLLVAALLAATLALLAVLERSRFGRRLRMVGEDELLAALSGIDVFRTKLAMAAAAGALAGLGGGLYAHASTYIEPRLFDVMLGVHSLAYGLIGGLGTALGPLLGVGLDIGLLESTQMFAGYRMIVFGGLVAVLLIWRPRGLLDERLLHRLARIGRR